MSRGQLQLPENSPAAPNVQDVEFRLTQLLRFGLKNSSISHSPLVLFSSERSVAEIKGGKWNLNILGDSFSFQKNVNSLHLNVLVQKIRLD